MDDEVIVGRLGKAHGVRGELSVEVRTDEPDRRFAAGAVLGCRRPDGAAAPRPALTVASTRWHQDRLLVSFEEIYDRTAAEEVRGQLLTVPVQPGERPEDPEEYYDHQLVGLRVLTTDGADVGSVAEVLHHGPQDLLVVRRAGAADALVPFVAELVPEVDLDRGRLVLDDGPGLLRLDEE